MPVAVEADRRLRRPSALRSHRAASSGPAVSSSPSAKSSATSGTSQASGGNPRAGSAGGACGGGAASAISGLPSGVGGAAGDVHARQSSREALLDCAASERAMQRRARWPHASLFIFGLGYSRRLHRPGARRRAGWEVDRDRAATGRSRSTTSARVRAALADASHVLSSVPPGGEGGDPVLDALRRRAGGTAGSAICPRPGSMATPAAPGSTRARPIGGGRRAARARGRRGLARARRAGVPPARHLRPGPQRARPRARGHGAPHRPAGPGVQPGPCRGHRRGRDRRRSTAPPGAYNLADDLPASQNAVIEEACRLLGVAPPPLQSLDEAGLSPQARGVLRREPPRRERQGQARARLAAALSDLSRRAARGLV